MNDMIVGRAYSNVIPAMSDQAIDKVRRMETEAIKLPTSAMIHIATYHVLHAGMYARTVMVPAGCTITGALIKIATLLIVNGHTRVFLDNEAVEMEGYKVLAASANRKQAFYAIKDTWITMVFASKAKTSEEAEKEFTDESDLLMSNKDGAISKITITGE